MRQLLFVLLGGIVVLIAEFVAKFNPPQDEMLVISQATRDKSERMKRLQNQHQHQHQQQQPQNHQQPNVGHSTTASTAAATPQQSKPWQSNFYPQQPQQVHATKLNLVWKNCEY